MRHPWFEGIDWNALLDRRVPAPIVPMQSRAGDAGNFQEFDNFDVGTMPGLSGTEDARGFARNFKSIESPTIESAVKTSNGVTGQRDERDAYRHLFCDF